MLEKREPEKCFYCENIAEYNDIVDDNGQWAVSSVCSVHASKYIQPS